MNEITTEALLSGVQTHADAPLEHTSVDAKVVHSSIIPRGVADLLAKLRDDGVLSEGQITQAMGVDRLTCREILDRSFLVPDAPGDQRQQPATANTQTTAGPMRQSVMAWVQAEAERRQSVAAYNAAVKLADRCDFPGPDINGEYQTMNAASSREHSARLALFDTISLGTSKPGAGAAAPVPATSPLNDVRASFEAWYRREARTIEMPAWIDHKLSNFDGENYSDIPINITWKAYRRAGTEAAATSGGLLPPDGLPRWIDDLKGKDPTIDGLIEYIISIGRAAPSAGAALVTSEQVPQAWRDLMGMLAYMAPLSSADAEGYLAHLRGKAGELLSGRAPAPSTSKADITPVDPEVEREEAMADTDKVLYMIYFDDRDRQPEIVVGGKRARYRYKQISLSWNAHLFVKINSNSRDCRHPSASVCVVADQQPAPKLSPARIISIAHKRDGQIARCPDLDILNFARDLESELASAKPEESPRTH